MRINPAMMMFVVFAGCGIEPHNSIGSDSPVHNGDNEVKKPAASDDSSSAKADLFCQVQKVFDDNCIKCHSANGLSPSLARGFDQSILIDKKGHHGNQLVKPGAATKSELFNLITSTDPNHRMPKNGPPLKKEDIDLIKTWINTGASFSCSQQS